MAYTTPTYGYEQQRNQLTQGKGQEDVQRDYGRFMSQERFRRSGEDMGRDFKRKFPKVGTHFNRRGMWNSGLRRQGQQEFAEDFRRNQGRLQFDQAANQAGFDMDQTQSDARFETDLLGLMEMVARQRAAGDDPFAAVRGSF